MIPILFSKGSPAQHEACEAGFEVLRWGSFECRVGRVLLRGVRGGIINLIIRKHRAAGTLAMGFIRRFSYG